jgi:hypothetical protein
LKKFAREIFESRLELNLLELSSSNPKQYWKTIKMLIKDKKCSLDNIPPLLTSNNSYAITDNEKANSLNEYFTSISTLDDTTASLPNFVPKTDVVLDKVVVTEQEIVDILLGLMVNKTSGPDEISHRMLKSTARTICKPLCILFNLSLNNCIYHDCWKSANVMPLFKKGDRNITSNYRPISLISCVGKIMERVVFKHVYNHLYFNNLIYRNQAGFLPGHSTVYQLIDIYNQICKGFDAKK